MFSRGTIWWHLRLQSLCPVGMRKFRPEERCFPGGPSGGICSCRACVRWECVSSARRSDVFRETIWRHPRLQSLCPVGMRKFRPEEPQPRRTAAQQGHT